MARFDPAQPLVHPLPDPDRVELRPDLVYTHAGGRPLAMDAYLPAGRALGTRVPAVLLVHGEANPDLLRGVRGWGQYTGWGRLLADQGMGGCWRSWVATWDLTAGRRRGWTAAVKSPLVPLDSQFRRAFASANCDVRHTDRVLWGTAQRSRPGQIG